MGHSVKQGIFLILPFIAVLASCGVSGVPAPRVSTSVESTGSGSSGGEKALDWIEILDLSSGSATISAEDPASEYVLIRNSTQQTGSDSTVQLAAEGAAALEAQPAALSLDTEEGPSDQLHDYLRAVENIVSESGEFEEVNKSSLSALTVGTPPTVGDIKTFNVISTMNSLTTYNELAGELRYASDNLYVYLTQENRDSIPDADLPTLAYSFYGIPLPRERALFGQESDINLDGHISILMTCTVNRMATSGGIVTGFFFPGDLYQRSSVNPASNAQEIFYTLVPDPDGKC